MRTRCSLLSISRRRVRMLSVTDRRMLTFRCELRGLPLSNAWFVALAIPQSSEWCVLEHENLVCSHGIDASNSASWGLMCGFAQVIACFPCYRRASKAVQREDVSTLGMPAARSCYFRQGCPLPHQKATCGVEIGALLHGERRGAPSGELVFGCCSVVGCRDHRLRRKLTCV